MLCQGNRDLNKLKGVKIIEIIGSAFILIFTYTASQRDYRSFFQLGQSDIQSNLLDIVALNFVHLPQRVWYFLEN